MSTPSCFLLYRVAKQLCSWFDWFDLTTLFAKVSNVDAT